MRLVQVIAKALSAYDRKMIFFNQIKFGEAEVIFYLWQLFEKRVGERDIKIGLVFCQKVF